MNARYSLENTVGGQGRQLSELATSFHSLQSTQKQSTEWQAKVTAHMEDIDKVIAALKTSAQERRAAQMRYLDGLKGHVPSRTSARRRGPGVAQQVGRGRRSSSAGAEHDREGPRREPGGQGAWATDVSFVGYMRGF